MGRGIDHLVIAGRDLDALADFYARLGFRVGAQNRHPWGTINRIVQFDGCFFELISTAADFAPPADDAPVAPFAGFLADYLAKREGLAMLVLESADARADQAAFEANGIAAMREPFFFERKGRRADGSEVHVAFTLAFARIGAIAGTAGFFVCQQHFPAAFWSADMQRHDNGATGIAAVELAVPGPVQAGDSMTRDLAAFTGTEPVRIEGGLAFATPRGRLAIVEGGESAAAGFRSITVTVPDLDSLARRLHAAAIPFEAGDGRLVIPASVAHGVALRFEPPAPPTG